MSIFEKDILIVDDEPEILESFCELLEVEGYKHVYKATNGTEAFKIICSQNIDLVISDVRMPNGNGVQLLENSMSHSPDKPVFLMITGYAEVTAEEARGKGARGLMHKPFDLEKFLGVISQMLSGNKQDWVEF